MCLDEVDRLGSFVEIEGSDEGKIAEVQKNLGLADAGHIQKGYHRLMSEQVA